MEIKSLRCASCGAPLEVSAAARYVTCSHCGSSLEVKRSDSAEWTELLQQVSQQTGQIQKEVEAIRAGQEIEQLDRAWQMRREELMVQTKEGGAARPSIATGVAGIIGIVVFVIFTIFVFPPFMNDTGSGGPPVRLFVCFFVVAIIAAILGALRYLRKAGEYDDEEQRYRRERAALLEKHERRQ